MDKAKYKQVKAAVGTLVGLIMAFSVIRNTWALAGVGVLFAMGLLYLAKQRVPDIRYDERTKIVREKAANATLSLVTVLLAVVGIGLVETSFWGYTANRDIGYIMAFMANIMISTSAGMRCL